jgi:hypothetical protein
VDSAGLLPSASFGKPLPYLSLQGHLCLFSVELPLKIERLLIDSLQAHRDL